MDRSAYLSEWEHTPTYSENNPLSKRCRAEYRLPPHSKMAGEASRGEGERHSGPSLIRPHFGGGTLGVGVGIGIGVEK
jgi:hypothetical protein